MVNMKCKQNLGKLPLGSKEDYERILLNWTLVK
jgi:hypothetical protein